MAKTAWSVAPRPRRTWLMYDGTTMPGPLVETTPARRRWRVAGTENSVEKYNLDTEIHNAMARAAAAKGTKVWLEMDDDEEAELHAHGRHGGNQTRFSFDTVIEPTFKRNTVVPVAFEFKHATLPLRTILWIVYGIDHSGRSAVSSRISYRKADPLTPMDHTVTFWDDKRPWANGSRERPNVPWKMETESFGSATRRAAVRFLEILGLAENMETLSIPDPRSDNPTELFDFEFSRTNYHPDLRRTMLDIVQSGPAMQRLAAHLKGIQRELTLLGVVTGDPDGFDLSGLLNGNLNEFRVKMEPHEDNTVEDLDGFDPHHSVHLDLARGIFAVSCSRHDLDDVAQAWDVAKFKAELTGETDVLLAFAQAYNNKGEQARLRKIINQRKVVPPTN